MNVSVSALLVALALPAIAGPSTQHFRFVPDDGALGLASHLESVAEDKRRGVLSVLGVADERVIEVRIASSEDEMERMLGTDRPVREWIAGLAISERDLIVMSARGNEVFHATDTFVHELAHVYLDAAAAGHRLPRWFHEGVAMLVASEEVGDRLRTVMGAAATGSFIPLSELVDGFPADVPRVHLAYGEAMLMVRQLQRMRGPAGVRTLLGEVRTGMPFDLAFQHVYGATPESVWGRVERMIDPTASLVVFLTSASLTWVAILVLFLVAYARKRRNATLRRDAWGIQDAIQTPPDEDLPN